jgi:hypothetical protein
MIEGNQIDDLFEASLNGLEVKPTMSAWDKLNQELDAIDSTAASFDAEANSIMRDFKVQPSSSVWAGLNQHLEAAAVAAASFDKSTSESMNDFSQQPSEEVWNNIESELDAIDVARIESKKRFTFWFSLSTTVAASILFFFMQFSSLNFFNSSKQQNPLVNKNMNNDVFVSTSNNKVTEENQENLSNTAIETTKIAKKDDVNDKDAPKDIVNNSNNTFNNIASKPNISIAKISSNDKDIAAIEEDKIVDNTEIFDVEEIAIKNMPSKNLILHDGLSQNDIANSTNIRIKSLKAAIGFSVDLFAGPELIINTINQNSSIGDQAILEEVKPVCTDFTFGANLKFHYNKFFIQSGLNYSSYGEQRLYQKNIEMHDTSGGFYTYNINSYITYDTIGWVDDPLQPGGISPQLSATLHSDTIGQHWNSQDSLYYDFEKSSSKNRYRYIEIPVMLGYKVNHKNWGFSLAAGVSYGFKVAEQGKYIDNGVIKTAFNTSSPYSGFTTNGIVSLGISYNINNRISVILQPTYKTNLQELNNLSASYQNISMRMGLNILL